ncbi:MAG: hypothetical protein HQL26_10755 [Candidatus Omnitrophica bacterium]|nr:hypothetical protein [Candidatus Omnitrophota bacterium]
MNKLAGKSHFIVIFLASLFCISLELFFTRILNLKAWNHVVYTVIPFAMLGFGIGANVVLVFNDFFKQFKTKDVSAVTLFLISLLGLVTAFLLKDIPIRVEYILSIFASAKAVSMLLLAYTVFMIPFMLIGFLIVYLFSNFSEESHTLYFFDLLGAGLGAYLFFPLISHFDVFHSLSIISLACFITAIWQISERWKWGLTILTIIVFVGLFKIAPEPKIYSVDPRKGWEWIPGYFDKKEYDQTSSQWHPLGRTELFRIKGAATKNAIYNVSPGTFEINLDPLPEYSYFSTNYLAGTPVYNFSPEGMAKNHSQVKLFSQRMEVPYTLLKNPKVLIIGAGGGRDIFMAHTHDAQEVIGAEINPGIVKAMSPGGSAYEYSGKIYTSPNTKIYNIDGRYLVKKLPPKSQDLIILNGVDTFSGLSSGAYAYAESYLYTKNAMEDYLRVLKDNGMINIYRWAFPDMPREELRLHAIALAALKTMGAKNPEDHIIVGLHAWSLFLIKKTPFTAEERQIIADYFKTHDVLQLYPAQDWLLKSNYAIKAFDIYTQFFRKNAQLSFEKYYPYDISVITDDNPFFYKYYKLSSFNPFHTFAVHHTGPVIFLTQTLILIQAIIFILLFILFPLYIRKKQDLKSLPAQSIKPFITFFACLGVGFMFIEIPMMQRFVLLLGSPIYSLSVVLAVLLGATGIGSLFVPALEKLKKSNETPLTYVTLCLIAYLAILIVTGTSLYNFFMNFSFLIRVLLVGGILFPIGFLLGLYFPLGLRLISKKYSSAIAWAWGINCGFSVLGSILSIIIAQFQGFNTVLLMACIVYLISLVAFKKMEQNL